MPDFLGFSSTCGVQTSIWIRESMPVGWGDTYIQSRPGQSFDITGLPNGTYFIQVETNATGVLHETDVTNNVSLQQVTIGGAPGARYAIAMGRSVAPQPAG